MSNEGQVMRKNKAFSRKDAENAKKSVNEQREKAVWTSRVGAFLRDLCGLSERSERAREKDYISQRREAVMSNEGRVMRKNKSILSQRRRERQEKRK